MIENLELHALADGELSESESRVLKERIASDPLASAELNSILNLRDTVRERAVKHTSDECWNQCRKRFVELDRANKVENFVTRYAWGICGAFFLMILMGRYAIQGVQGDSTRTADLIPMFSSLTEKRAPKSQAATEIDRWLDDLMGRARARVQSNQMQFLGGAAAPFRGGQITRLDLADAQGPITLFVVPGVLNLEDTAPLPGSPPVFAGEISGTNCVAWSDRGFTMLMVAPRSYAMLQSAAGRVRLN